MKHYQPAEYPEILRVLRVVSNEEILIENLLL